MPALHWGPCPAATPEEEAALAGYECSVAEVPLSYRDPNGQTIELALGRLPALDQEHKLGSLGDRATPYEDAQQTQAILADARLLTLESFGHTAQGGRSRCIDDAVDRYMIELKLPPQGAGVPAGPGTVRPAARSGRAPAGAA